MNHGHLAKLQEIPDLQMCNIQFDRDYINTSQETNKDVTVVTGNVAATWHRVNYNKVDPELLRPYLG